MFDAGAIRAQSRLHEIQGGRHTYFCGSYVGYGFHEDALASGLDIAELLGAPRPWRLPDGARRVGTTPRPASARPPRAGVALPVAARMTP
jgi:predicted NAD/FAD-binding protein